MALIPFSEWRPDSPSLGQFARTATNVIPDMEAYRPFNSLATVTNALTARAQGAAWFRGTGGAVKMFAGDATKLYLLSGTTWTSVPKLAANKAITAITQANPGKVTAVGHGYSNGDTIYISGVVGMTEVNGSFYTITVVDADNFTIGVNTSAYTAYSSGGNAQKATIYAPGSDGNWRFTQFGSLAIAVNGVDSPQKFDLAAGTNFADLGGSPPVGTFIATVRDFVVMGKIGSTPQRVQWSPYNNAEGTWGSVASTQADYQDLPDGGNITGLVGGEYGIVFSESAVRRMTYEGPPTVFRFDKIANDVGCSVPNSVAAVGDTAIFLHKSGFYAVQGGQNIEPIGFQKVDRTFWAEFDETNLHRCSAAFDPVRALYMFAYPSNGSSGTPNRILVYSLRAKRWTRIVQECDMVYGGVSQVSVTLEGLDAYGTLETLPYSLDSSFWSGAVSLLLFGFDTSHKSGSFSGTTMEATLETGEFNPGGGSRVYVRSARPLVDGGSPYVSLGARETQQASVTYGSEVGLTVNGAAPVLGSGRYFRVKMRHPAGETWTHALGIDDLDVRKSGAQ